MKMSDLFELPMVVDGYSVESQPSIPTGCVVEFVSDIECDSGRDAKYVAHAINNHDRMVEEIAELKGALESLHHIALLGDFGTEIYSGTLLESDVLKLLNQEGEG